MGRPGRAGRGVRLGEGGGGRGLMHAPRKRACAMAFNTPTSCNPFPMGQRQCPRCSAVWGLGPREWGRRGGGGRAESDGTWGRTPLTCDGSVLGVGVGSTAGVDAAPPLDEAGGVNSPPVVLGGVDAPAPNASKRLRGCTAGVPGGGGGAAHVGDRRSCAGRRRSQAQAGAARLAWVGGRPREGGGCWTRGRARCADERGAGVERRGRGVERIGREEGGERVVGKRGGGSGAARRGRGRAGGVRRGRAGSRRGRAGRGVSDLRPDRGRRRCGRRCGRKRRSRWSPRGGGLGPLGRGIVEEAKRRQGIERANAVYEAVERT
jgi:hypothetical protein